MCSAENCAIVVKRDAAGPPGDGREGFGIEKSSQLLDYSMGK